MNLLAEVAQDGTMSGSIEKNNLQMAFVECFDFHIEEFTVMQNLYYSAALRMNKKMTRQERLLHCAHIADMVGLTQVLDVVVGSGLRKGISGGQQKLLSIANELLSLPDILCLDEPTSGLYNHYY